MSSNSPFGKPAEAQGGLGSSSFDFQKRAARSGLGAQPVKPVGSPVPLAVGTGQAPTRLDDLTALLSSIGLPAQPDPESPNTVIIPVKGEPRFRVVVPPQSHFMMLVADVYTGSETEIAQMAPSLLHANYTCQRLALETPIADMQGSISPGEAEAQWLPVMGLDLERMTVVLSLQIPYRRVDEEDFGDFMSGLVETISRDAEVLVQQFKAITAAAG
jgi:hypothetical protein